MILRQHYRIVAAAEQERFCRRKHAYGEGPYDAIKFCLESEKITLDDIEHVAISWEPKEMEEKLSVEEREKIIKDFFPKNIFCYNQDVSFSYVRHHMAHLASAFYQSGFTEAACLIIDGQGENESITFAKAHMGKIDIIKKFPIAYSLGAFYDAAAGYVGLGFDVAGKFMGLAPYGEANQEIPLQFDEVEGEFLINIDDFDVYDSFFDVRSKYINHFRRNNYPYNCAPFQEVETAELMTYIDFAASVQATLDNIIIKMAKYLKKITQCENLVMAGGVTLNCTSNGKLDKARIFKNIFIYPAANDGGCSVGAALEVARQKGMFDLRVPNRIVNVYLGKKYNDDYEAILKNSTLEKEYIPDDIFFEFIANLLTNNNVLAWFQSGFEFGPRALGARSIIASPLERENINRINKIKQRELWRPLSPIVLDRYYKDVFIDDNPHNMSEFMLKTCEIKDDWQSRIPAVVHIDKTSRPQYLTREANEKMYGVLESFYKKTGVPLLINTSFNLKKQPIINSPREAMIELENNSGLSGLILGNWYVRRPKQ